MAREFFSISWPAINTLPAVGGRYEVRMRIKVVFPAPFFPRNPTISPLPISKEIFLSASIFPKFLEMFWTITIEMDREFRTRLLTARWYRIRYRARPCRPRLYTPAGG